MEKNKGSEKTLPILRREKISPCEDFWHTLRVGIPVALLLFVVMPFILPYAMRH